MDSTHLNEKMLRLRFPYHQMQSYLDKLTKLKLTAATSTLTNKGKRATNFFRQHQDQVAEVLKRAKEPYYKMLPYRNRSDGSPSWQYRIIWNQSTHKGCVAAGGNRIGKSQMGAFITAMIVTGQHPTYKSPKNGRIWIAGPDSKVIKAVQQPYFEKTIPERYIKNGKWNGKDNCWRLNCDGRKWEVWFKSYDSGRDKFQSDNIDFIWMDEEPKNAEDIFPEIEIRLIDRCGLWMLTATPVMGTRWLKELMERDDVYATMAGMRENPYLSLKEIEKVARQLSKDERDVRIDGKYLVFGGRPVFDRDSLSKMDDCKLPFSEGVLSAA